MFKKVISLAMALCLIFAVGVMAENDVGVVDDSASVEIPPRENVEPSQRPQGNFDPSQIPQGGFDPSKMPQGNFDPSKMPNGAFVSREGDNPDKTNGTIKDGSNDKNTQNEENTQPEDNKQTNENNSQFGGGFPGGMGGFSGNMQSGMQNTQSQPTGFVGFLKTYETPLISVVLLALAYVFVIFYKRKRY